MNENPELLTDSERRSELVGRMIDHMAQISAGHEYRRARNELRTLPADLIIDPLIARIRQARSVKAYDRTVRELARIGGDRAVEALFEEACKQRQYPRMAVRALAQCEHPQVVDYLIELLTKGKGKQKRAAAKYLAKVGKWRAIEPLCRAAQSTGQLGQSAKEALRKMGPAHRIARLVFESNEPTVNERVSALEAVSTVMWFNPERFLDRETRRWLSPWKAQAREAVEALRAKKLLLRPAGPVGAESLLRAAANGSGTEHDLLLRASNSDTGEEPDESANRTSWVRQATRRLRGILR